MELKTCCQLPFQEIAEFSSPEVCISRRNIILVERTQLALIGNFLKRSNIVGNFHTRFMENFPFEEFKNDYIIKTIVQEKQYEQWLKAFFFLNNELTNKYDFVYQDAFYVKFYELFTAGIVYANRILTSLKKGNNSEKINWYLKFVDGLNSLRAELSDTEFLYIEYRRHSASHIFQNSYEHIQENLRIKKERNGKKLEEIKTEIENLILKYGSDKNVDKHINSKLQLKISKLHKQLT